MKWYELVDKYKVLFLILLYFFASLTFFAIQIVTSDDKTYDKSNLEGDLIYSFVAGLCVFALDLVTFIKGRIFNKKSREQ